MPCRFVWICVTMFNSEIFCCQRFRENVALCHSVLRASKSVEFVRWNKETNSLFLLYQISVRFYWRIFFIMILGDKTVLIIIWIIIPINHLFMLDLFWFTSNDTSNAINVMQLNSQSIQNSKLTKNCQMFSKLYDKWFFTSRRMQMMHQIEACIVQLFLYIPLDLGLHFKIVSGRSFKITHVNTVAVPNTNPMVKPTQPPIKAPNIHLHEF